MKIILFGKDNERQTITCDKAVVVDALDRPLVAVLTIGPGTIVYAHCGEPEFIEYLRHIDPKLIPPNVIIKNIRDILEPERQITNGNNSRQTSGQRHTPERFTH